MARTHPLSSTTWPDAARPEMQALQGSSTRLRWGDRNATAALYLALRVGGRQTPLLLVHGVSFGASASDMRPVFDWFADPRTEGGSVRSVAALELPGFGGSERAAKSMAPIGQMTEAVGAAIDALAARCKAGRVDVCAQGLSCEFVALAALQRSSRVRSLALINPTGLEGGRLHEVATAEGGVRALQHLLSLPGVLLLLGQALARRASLRRALERCWDSPLIDERLLDDRHRNAARPHASTTLKAWLSGAWRTPQIIESYRRLAMPVWLAHGVRGPQADLNALPHLAPASRWTHRTYDTGAMPHFEHRRLFCTQYAAFLRGMDRSG